MQARRYAWGKYLKVQLQHCRRPHTGSDRVAGANRKSVDARPVEARHVDFGNHLPCQDAVQGSVQRDGLGPEWTQMEMLVKAGDSLVAINHLQELVLLRQAAQGCFDILHAMGPVLTARCGLGSSQR